MQCNKSFLKIYLQLELNYNLSSMTVSCGTICVDINLCAVNVNDIQFIFICNWFKLSASFTFCCKSTAVSPRICPTLKWFNTGINDMGVYRFISFSIPVFLLQKHAGYGWPVKIQLSYVTVVKRKRSEDIILRRQTSKSSVMCHGSQTQMSYNYFFFSETNSF